MSKFGGRPTLISGKPLMDRDVTSSMAYYAPGWGGTIPVLGVDIPFISSPTDAVGLSLDISGLAAHGIYDLFGIDNGSGFAQFVAGPAWNAITATQNTNGTGATPWSNPTRPFNGNTKQSTATCSRNTPSNAGLNNCFEQDWSSPVIVSSVVLYGPDNDYMRGDAPAVLPVAVDGWNGSAWVNLWSGNINASSSSYGFPFIVPGLPQTSYAKHRVNIGGNGISAINIAQVIFCNQQANVRSVDLAVYNGVLTNGAAITAYAGPSSSVPVAANAGTYLATIQMDATAGQCSYLPSFGTNRKCGIWSPYNQREIILQAGNLALGSYQPPVLQPQWGPSRGDFGNSLTVLTGLPTSVMADLQQAAYMTGVLSAPAGSTQFNTGIGWNQTMIPDHSQQSATLEPCNVASAVGNFAYGSMHKSDYGQPDFCGSALLTALESAGVSAVGGKSQTWGTRRDMTLFARYMG